MPWSYYSPGYNYADEFCPHCSPRKADKNDKKRPHISADVHFLPVLMVFLKFPRFQCA